MNLPCFRYLEVGEVCNTWESIDGGFKKCCVFSSTLKVHFDMYS